MTVKAFYSQTLAFFSAFLKRGMEVTTCLDGQLYNEGFLYNGFGQVV